MKLQKFALFIIAFCGLPSIPTSYTLEVQNTGLVPLGTLAVTYSRAFAINTLDRAVGNSLTSCGHQVEQRTAFDLPLAGAQDGVVEGAEA